LPHTVKVILLGDRFDNEKPRAQTNFKVTDDSIYREKMWVVPFLISDIMMV
jgi:hypothetical protein